MFSVTLCPCLFGTSVSRPYMLGGFNSRTKTYEPAGDKSSQVKAEHPQL